MARKVSVDGIDEEDVEMITQAVAKASVGVVQQLQAMGYSITKPTFALISKTISEEVCASLFQRDKSRFIH